MIPTEFLPGFRAYSKLTVYGTYEGYVRNSDREIVFRTPSLYKSPHKARSAAQTGYKNLQQMKVIVEKSPQNTAHSFMFMFYYLIDVLNTCKSEADVRIVAGNDIMKAHFDMGLCKHHFWAHEKNSDKRLVIVEF